MRRFPSRFSVPKFYASLVLGVSACASAESEQPPPDASGNVTTTTDGASSSRGAGSGPTLPGKTSTVGTSMTNSGGVTVGSTGAPSATGTSSGTAATTQTSSSDATSISETLMSASDVSDESSTSGSEAPSRDSEAANSSSGSSEQMSSGDGNTGEQGPITVWLAGDSTVRNSAPCAGWGDQFQAFFNENVTVVNSALAGRGIRQWLYYTTDMLSGDDCVVETDGNGQPRVQERWQNMLDNMKAGDYLLIQFGINDGAACPRRTSEPEYARVLGMMAQAAEERGARAVFLTAVSAIACNGTTATGSRGSKEPGSRGFVDETFAAGEEYGVPVIDLHQLSIDLYNELGFCPVAGGDVSEATTGPVGEFFCNDHTHFEASGASGIAELVAQALVEQGVGLGEYRR